MTRIVLDPPQLHAAARLMTDAGIEVERSALGLAGLPLPEMPPWTRGQVEAGIHSAAIALARSGDELVADARELDLRASIAQLGETAPGALHGLLSFLQADGKWIGKGLSFFGPGGVLPVVLATASGYRVIPRGDYAILRGDRFLGDGALARYLRTGRPAGTRYRLDNPKIARDFDLRAALGNTMREAGAVGDPAFWRAARKGGGPLALGLTLGGDLYEFSPWGGHARQGIASTDFAANAIVDTGLLAGGAAVSSGAGAAAGMGAGMLATAAFGAEVGSVVPGVGTVVGFGVGLGITYLMVTPEGRAVRDALVRGTKEGLDFVVHHPLVLAGPAGVPVQVAWDLRGHLLDAAETGLHGAQSAVRGAGDLAGGAVDAAGSGLHKLKSLVHL